MFRPALTRLPSPANKEVQKRENSKRFARAERAEGNFHASACLLCQGNENTRPLPCLACCCVWVVHCSSSNPTISSSPRRSPTLQPVQCKCNTAEMPICRWILWRRQRIVARARRCWQNSEFVKPYHQLENLVLQKRVRIFVFLCFRLELKTIFIFYGFTSVDEAMGHEAMMHSVWIVNTEDGDFVVQVRTRAILRFIYNN